MRKQQTEGPIGAGVAWAILIGFAIIFPFLVIFVSGWGTTTQNKALDARVLSLETQVKKLKQQVGSLDAKVNQMTAGPTATPTVGPTATSTYRLTPVPSDSVLVVVVAKGNVRAGPSTNHAIIGSVKAGDIIEKPLGHNASRWYRFCCVDGNKPGWLGPIVVKEQKKSSTAIRTTTKAPTRVPTKAATGNSYASITAPPSSLGVSPIYQKYMNANGAHILALADVSNQSMVQARDIVYGMVSTRPDLLAALTTAGLRIILFDDLTTSLPQLPEFKDWPLAGQRTGGYALNGSSHTVAVPERHLRCGRLLTHELGHAVEYVVQALDSGFAAQRDAAYQNAMQTGKWKGEYAATNKHEYWAVAVEHWFHSEALATKLSRRDPEAAQLVKSVFGDAKLSSQPCR